MRSRTAQSANRLGPPSGEIDALSDAALRLLASVEQAATPLEALQIRRRAIRLVELADQLERNGSRIMTDQPSLRDAFPSLGQSFPNA